MDRRKAMHLAGVSGLATAFPKTVSAESVLGEYIKHWNVSKKYTLDMMKAMPIEHFDFKVTPEQMPFGNQFTHLGYFNTFLLGFIFEKDAIPEPELFDFETTQRYVLDTYDFCLTILSDLKEKDLEIIDNQKRPGWLADKSNRELIHRAEVHTSHHRGQAVAYLRLKGIKPPSFKV